MFTLNLADFGKGLFVAVLAAVAIQLLAVVNTPGFDFSLFNWSETARVALASGLGYIVKNFITDKQGNILGIGA